MEGGRKNVAGSLVSSLLLMWAELELMGGKNVMSFDVLWNVFFFSSVINDVYLNRIFSKDGAATMS